MAEDQQASPSFEAALDGDGDAARARGNSLASAFLDEAEADFSWDRLLPRDIAPEDWKRYEGYVAEIFTALGMDLHTPGTRRTPERFLRALYESTSGYEGDPNLLTAFPTECRGGPDCRLSQVIEGPINFFALCEHHALPFFGVAHVGYVPHDSIIGIACHLPVRQLRGFPGRGGRRRGDHLGDDLARQRGRPLRDGAAPCRGRRRTDRGGHAPAGSRPPLDRREDLPAGGRGVLGAAGLPRPAAGAPAGSRHRNRAAPGLDGAHPGFPRHHDEGGGSGPGRVAARHGRVGGAVRRRPHPSGGDRGRPPGTGSCPDADRRRPATLR